MERFAGTNLEDGLTKLKVYYLCMKIIIYKLKSFFNYFKRNSIFFTLFHTALIVRIKTGFGVRKKRYFDVFSTKVLELK